MNTPQWMIEAPADAPVRAKTARHTRRSTDGVGLNVVDVTLAFLAMLVTMWAICELNAVLFR